MAAKLHATCGTPASQRTLKAVGAAFTARKAQLLALAGIGAKLSMWLRESGKDIFLSGTFAGMGMASFPYVAGPGPV